MTSDITIHSKIGEIVAEDYRTASVFKKFGIDFCCGGGRSIEEACARKGADAGALLAAIDELDRESPRRSSEYNKWEIDFLADYIVNKYHLYVREKCPEIMAYADKVAKVHGEWRPETVEVARRFAELRDELMSHMAKEEQILFPYIKRLVSAGKGGEVPRPPFGTVANPVHMMEEEHDAAGAIMKEIRELSGDYQPPEGACNTYRVLYAMLDEFEENLHAHVHLENNILFPKAIAREQALR